MAKFNDFGIEEIKPLNSNIEGRKESSVMTLEATVDSTKQKLNVIKPYSQSQASVPTDIPSEAQIVMHALFDCFDRQKEVKEGVITDLIWGFQQSGIEDRLTVGGLAQLEERGYIKFQAPDNAFVDIKSTHIDKAWVRYQKKLLDLVYEAL